MADFMLNLFQLRGNDTSLVGFMCSRRAEDRRRRRISEEQADEADRLAEEEERAAKRLRGESTEDGSAYPTEVSLCCSWDVFAVVEGCKQHIRNYFRALRLLEVECRGMILVLVPILFCPGIIVVAVT